MAMVPVRTISLMPMGRRISMIAWIFACRAGHLDGIGLGTDIDHLAPENVDDPQDLGPGAGLRP